MAASVGNLLRTVHEFPIHKVDPHIGARLHNIEKGFSILLRNLQAAEWKRDLHEQEWGKNEAQITYRIDNWASQVAALAAYVEEIAVTYNFHLLNLNTGTFYSKFLGSCSFMLDTNNVAAKIRSYFSNLALVSTSIDQTRNLIAPAEDCILVLEKLSDVLSGREILRLARTISPPQLDQPVDNLLSNQDSRYKRIQHSADMLGRGNEVKLLEGWLLAKEDEDDPQIISLTGKAGIGKTMVAEAVYEQVQKHFDCHAWVSVSKNDSTRCVMQNILKGMLESISVMAQNKIEMMEKESLEKLINTCLIGKKFLLILDDVPSWEIVQQVMNAILHKHACSSEGGTEFCSSVQSVVEHIARLCDGLPLALVTIGRMLSTKHTAEDWIKVYQMFAQGASFMSLCYADLSPALQSCFLYTASFPCHYEISCEKLKRLWIAEGFIQQDNNRTLEETAQLQLEELIYRNIIQVVKLSIDGEVKTCRILRKMREFGLRRSIGDRFSAILQSLKSTIQEKCRRVFLYGATNDASTDKFSRKDFSRLNSFLAFAKNQHQSLNLNDFILLRVLELQGFCHELLPDALGDLRLLQYLGLRGSKTKKLPASFKRLHRLQTLDIRDTFITDLPTDLEGLGMMRHLLLEGSFTDKVVELRDGVEVFKDLQTLAGLKMTETIAKGLIYLRNIRKLSIGAVKGFHLGPLFKAIEGMEFLRSFTMKGSFEDQSYELPLPPVLYNLEKLRIGGPMKKNYLDWVGELHHLKCLYFWDSKLTKDPIGALQHLPNLVLLSLCNSYDGQDIEFRERGYPKLKKLSILHCRNLRNWKDIPAGVMINLETLNLGYCPSLVEPPKGLEKLHSLRSLIATWKHVYYPL